MDAIGLVDAQCTALATGDQELMARVWHPEAVNHMAADEPHGRRRAAGLR